MIHQYKLNGYNIVLDVYSGSVHAVDELAYDAIRLLDKGMPREEISAQLCEKYAASPQDVADVFEDIDELTAQGFRFVTVSELAALSGTQLQGGQVYHRFSFAKNASISGREAETEPCTKPGFPPPLPRSASFIARQSPRRSPSRAPMAY